MVTFFFSGLYDLMGPKTVRFIVFRPFWALKPIKTTLKEVLEVLLEVLEVALEVQDLHQNHLQELQNDLQEQ